MKTKKGSAKEVIAFIIGVLLFLLAVMLQGRISAVVAEIQRNGGSPGPLSSANGIIVQLQVLISVVMVVIGKKKGVVTAVVINLLNAAYTLVVVTMLTKNFGALPGVVSPIITAITCYIIYSYSAKVTKANDELKKANEDLIENNRIIREKDQKLIYLAYYDVLTGLANRQLFIEQIDESIEKDNKEPFTVISANIDDFKLINESYGHNAGDIILSTYADRLKQFCGESAFVGKLDGDEFAILLKGESTDAFVLAYIEKLCSAVCAPVIINGNPFNASLSFGVAYYPNDGRNSAEILKSTDFAVNNAKAGGRGRTCFCSHRQTV